MTQPMKSIWIPVLLAVLLMGSGADTDVCADEGHHEGLLMNVRAGQIAILNRSRSATNVYPLANLVQVTRNGLRANLRDLRPGDSIQILTETRFQREFVVTVNAVADD